MTEEFCPHNLVSRENEVIEHGPYRGLDFDYWRCTRCAVRFNPQTESGIRRWWTARKFRRQLNQPLPFE